MKVCDFKADTYYEHTTKNDLMYVKSANPGAIPNTITLEYSYFDWPRKQWDILCFCTYAASQDIGGWVEASTIPTILHPAHQRNVSTAMANCGLTPHTMEARDFKSNTYYRHAVSHELMYVKHNILASNGLTVTLTFSIYDTHTSVWPLSMSAVQAADTDASGWAEELQAPPIPYPVPAPVPSALHVQQLVQALGGYSNAPIPNRIQYSFIIVGPAKCECGSTKCGLPRHSDWCPCAKKE